MKLLEGWILGTTKRSIEGNDLPVYTSGRLFLRLDIVLQEVIRFVDCSLIFNSLYMKQSQRESKSVLPRPLKYL